MKTRILLVLVWGLVAGAAWAADRNASPIFTPTALPEKVVVLTFDDAISSQYAVVAPLLKAHGFGATFYICEFPPDFESDKVKYLTWEQIAELHQMGFEIANHTRTHRHIGELSDEALRAELNFIEERCQALGIPKTVSFAYPGYGLRASALPVFEKQGFLFARAGGNRCYDPTVDHPYLVPSFDISGNDEAKVLGFLKQAAPGKIVVLTVHGVPDLAHAWVNTPPELFQKYLQFLSDQHYTVLAMRDLARYIDANKTRELLAPAWEKQFTPKAR